MMNNKPAYGAILLSVLLLIVYFQSHNLYFKWSERFILYPLHPYRKVCELCTNTHSSQRGIRVLSYTMFGKDAVKNYGEYVKLVSKEVNYSSLYQDWEVRIYHEDSSLADEFVNEVRTIYPRVEFYNVLTVSGGLREINGMVWRFVPMGDLTVDVTCVRDLDSEILPREEDAVREWLASDKIFHVMRDRPVHSVPVLGGTWCFRNQKDRKFGKRALDMLLSAAERRGNGTEATKGDDQDILGGILWPWVKSDTIHHDSYLCQRFGGASPFPSKRDYEGKFVGCIRPCVPNTPITCPNECRPKDHQDWELC